MDVLMRALENVKRLWGGLAPTQRVVLAASAAAMVALLAWGSGAGVSEAMVRVVGAEVDESTRAKVLQRFSQGQKYELRNREIYVPKADADRVMLELAGDGVLSDDAVWKFLEQDNIFATRWDREKRYQVALQNRLQSMIRRVEGVRNAAVVINPGSASSTLGFQAAKASASVQVELQEGRGLTSGNVQAIAGLVARAVPGVEVDQVHIMDTAGRPYRALKPDSSAFMAQTHRDYEHQIEQQIQKDIKSHLPSAMVVVRVQARNSDVETEEVRHSNPKAVESEERKEVQKGAGSQAPVGIKGEGSLTQAPEGGGGQGSTTTETRERSVTDVTKKRERDPAGAIQKITVGVLIPVESGAEGKELGDAQKLLPTYKEWVQAAAGPWADAKSVSVQLIPSRKPEPAAVSGVAEGILSWVSSNAPKVAMGVLALFVLVAILRTLRTAMPKDTVEELSALTAAITQTVESSSGPAGAAGEPNLEIPAESDVVRLKTGLKEMVTRNPQNVATSLKAFLGGQAK